MRRWMMTAALGFAAGGATGVAMGQPGADSEFEPIPEPAPESRLSLEPTASYAFETDLDGAGEYSVARFGLNARYRIPILERSTLSFGATAQRHEYDFSGATGLAPGGDPLGGASVFGVSARVVHPIDDRLSFLGGASVEWAGEDGADFGDALIPAGFAAVGWRASDRLTLTLGAQVKDQLEDDVRVLPVIGVEYQIDERLRLTSTEVGRVLADVGGGGLGLVYEASDELSYVAGAVFASGEFRLDEDGPIPDGVLRDDRVIAALGLAWEPNASTRATIAVGATVWSNIEVLDSGGSELGDEDGDPAPFVTARVRILF
jgi:hypothetical protein